MQPNTRRPWWRMQNNHQTRFWRMIYKLWKKLLWLSWILLMGLVVISWSFKSKTYYFSSSWYIDIWKIHDDCHSLKIAASNKQWGWLAQFKNLSPIALQKAMIWTFKNSKKLWHIDNREKADRKQSNQLQRPFLIAIQRAGQ